MDAPVVRLVETPAEREAAFALRVRVFVQEQGVPTAEELDEHDLHATHFIALLNGEAIGTGRVVYEGVSGERGPSGRGPAMGGKSEARIGRMAVDWEWRRKGVGGRVLQALEEEVRRAGVEEAVLHAQSYVKAFYASHGYKEEGEPFLEAGIEHVLMRKRL